MLSAVGRWEQQEDLARIMSGLALDLQSENDREATLAAIVRSAVATVPGTSWAGISLIRGSRITAEATTHDLVREVDRLQADLGEGPCIHAIRHNHTVRIDDLADEDQRWPRFADKAADRGVRSLLAFQLFVRAETLGALNLYGDAPAAFTGDAEIIGDVFASHAAVALAEAIQDHQLTEALRSRDIIGQAKGILMLRHRLTGQQAFNLLVRASQAANMKLVNVADWLVNDVENHIDAPPNPPQAD